jgi:hypothetical protein
MLSRTLPTLPVIAYDEIIQGTDISPIETVSIQMEEKMAELAGVAG